MSSGLSSNEVSEPRREMSLTLLIFIAEKVDETNFREVQAFFILLIMYFTYSRSECPCPKSFTGREAQARAAMRHITTQPEVASSQTKRIATSLTFIAVEVHGLIPLETRQPGCHQLKRHDRCQLFEESDIFYMRAPRPHLLY